MWVQWAVYGTHGRTLDSIAIYNRGSVISAAVGWEILFDGLKNMNSLIEVIQHIILNLYVLPDTPQLVLYDFNTAFLNIFHPALLCFSFFLFLFSFCILNCSPCGSQAMFTAWNFCKNSLRRYILITIGWGQVFLSGIQSCFEYRNGG